MYKYLKFLRKMKIDISFVVHRPILADILYRSGWNPQCVKVLFTLSPLKCFKVASLYVSVELKE